MLRQNRLELEEENTKLSEEITKLREELAEARAKNNAQFATLIDLANARDRAEERADRAEARNAEAERQEPEYWVYDGSDVGSGWGRVSKEEYDAMPEQWRRKFYTRPIPPADVAELQERAQFWADRCGMLEGRVAELERKLNDAVEKQPCNAGACKEEMIWREELAKAREEGYEQGKRDAVPEGWQAVPKEPNSAMLLAGKRTVKGMDNGEFESEIARCAYVSMLAAAPKLEAHQPLKPAGAEDQKIYDEIAANYCNPKPGAKP